MQRAIIIVLLFLSFGLKAQVYQAMPQAGYGPVKRFLTDSVLTIPTGINSLRNITGGRDAGQIRWNTTDSSLYMYSGSQWIKINTDTSSLNNKINGKLNISDTAAMLATYLNASDTISLSNRINLRVKYSDTAAMLLPYLRKLDTASLSDRINKKMDSLILTTIGTGGLATLLGTTLNIPNYGGALTGYVPYSGATNNVTLGSYNLTGTLLNADYALQVKNGGYAGATNGYTSLTSYNEGFSFFTNWMSGPTTLTKGASLLYPTTGTTFQYQLPIRNGTLALVEDTVSLSNRINLKIGASDTVSLSNRINLKVNISDTASMLLPYLRKGDTTSLSNRIDLKLNASDTASLSNRINLKLNISDTASMLSSYQSAINARVKYTDTAAMLDPYLTAAVTSVGLSMPVAFSVSNSPITSTGTIAVSAIGNAAQYIRGDGQLATLPTGGGGGSSVNYYLNGGTSQGTIGGSTYYEMSKDAVIGVAADFNRTNAQDNGLISQFITDANDPNRTEIPAGAWNFEMFFSASSSGGSPSYYIELLKYDGSTFTSIATGSAIPELITSGTTIDLYLSSLAVPYTTLSITDRLVVRVYVVTSGKTITLHTQNGHLCLITTTFAGGVSSLNGLNANTQYLAVGTAGTDFAINSLTDTHTFNLPTASATNRGALSSADWSTFNGKMNYTDTVSLSNRINTKLNSSDTTSLSNRINAKADALSGTTNTVPKFTSSTTIGNSNIKDDGNIVTVNATAGSFGALQVGNYNGNILMNTNNTSAGLIFQNTSASNKKWDFSSNNNDLVFNESNVNPVMTLQAGGNVGINVTNPSNKLEVNGTFKSVGVATFGSTLTNGTYTYTLPSGTGTLALTSAFDTTSLSNRINLKLNSADTASLSNRINAKQPQLNGTGFVKASGTTISYDNSTYATTSALSGYLPLTGGTLTGALGGTSASFNSSVTTGSAGLTIGTSNYAGNEIQIGNGATDFAIDLAGSGKTDIYSSSILTFNTALAPRMTITSSGNVGIGTTSPTSKLNVYTTTGNIFSKLESGDNSRVQYIATNSVNSGNFGIESTAGATYTNTLASAALFASNGDFALQLITNSIARMTITSGGNVGIGNTVVTNSAGYSRVLNVYDGSSAAVGISIPSYDYQFGVESDGALRVRYNGSSRLTIASTGAATFSSSVTGTKFTGTSGRSLLASSNDELALGVQYNNTSGAFYFGATNSANPDAVFRNGNGDLILKLAYGGAVTINNLGTGTVTASSGILSTVSDSSYKISDGFIENALPSVMNLKPRYFYWKDKSGLDTTIRQLGFYAQEVNSAIGEEAANTPKKDSPWGINDRSIIAYLTKAIQELSVKNEALIKRIETLENK